MRFSSGLALSGVVSLASAAATEPAEVYILSSTTSSSSSIPQIPRQVARHLFLNRLGAQTSLDGLPESTSTDEALAWIAEYGRAPRPLFQSDAASSTDSIAPSQLLVILEGISPAAHKDLKAKLKVQPSFSIADAPSSKATKQLVDVDLSAFSASCNIEAAINPYDKCWKTMSAVVKYDPARVRIFRLIAVSRVRARCHANSSQDTDSIQSFIDNLPALRDAVSSGTLEATLLILPESARSSPHSDWSSAGSSELRRRAETPLLDNKVAVASAEESTPLVGALVAETPAQINLGCFSSYNSCVTASNNCTGHGTCIDKFAASTSNGQSGDKQCFVCACGLTKTNPDAAGEDLHTQWGGAYCQKVDISSQFWLLAGTSILLVGVVTGSIALLFNVGEEKLPGVIGAGVSRSK